MNLSHFQQTFRPPQLLAMIIAGIASLTDSNSIRTIHIFSDSQSMPTLNRLLSATLYRPPPSSCVPFAINKIPENISEIFGKNYKFGMRFKQLPMYENKLHIFIVHNRSGSIAQIIHSHPLAFHVKQMILIVFLGDANDEAEQTESVLEQFWNDFRFSRVAVMRANSNLNRLNIHTYQPYADLHSCDTWQWIAEDNRLVGPSFARILRDKSGEFNGRELRVRIPINLLVNFHITSEGATKLTGEDVMFGALLAEKFNASLNIVVMHWNSANEFGPKFMSKWRLPIPVIPSIYRKSPTVNITYIESIEEYLSTPVNIDTVYHPERLEQCVHLYPHKSSKILVLVPIVLNQLDADNSLKIIVTSPFFYWFFMVFCVALIRRTFHCHHQRRSGAGHDLVGFALDNFGIMLGASGGFTPKCRSERFVQVAMSFSALFLSTVFTSILYRDSYSLTQNLTSIDSLWELNRSNLSITMTKADVHIIKNNSKLCHQLCKNLSYRDRIITLDYSEFWSSYVTNSNISAFVLPGRFIDIFTVAASLEEVNTTGPNWLPYHKMNEPLAIHYESYLLPSPSGLEANMNKWMHRIREHGFAKVIRRRIRRIQKFELKNDGIEELVDLSGVFAPISFLQLRDIFYVYVILAVVAIICCAFEFVLHKCSIYLKTQKFKIKI